MSQSLAQQCMCCCSCHAHSTGRLAYICSIIMVNNRRIHNANARHMQPTPGCCHQVLTHLASQLLAIRHHKAWQASSRQSQDHLQQSSTGKRCKTCSE
jgi:hypothetical protein